MLDFHSLTGLEISGECGSVRVSVGPRSRERDVRNSDDVRLLFRQLHLNAARLNRSAPQAKSGDINLARNMYLSRSAYYWGLTKNDQPMKQDEPKKHEPKKHEPEPHKDPNGEIRQIHGRVFNYSLNPRGEVDGLLLEDGTFIKFAPHLGRELTQVTKPNDEVTVIGSLEAPRLIKGYVVVNPATGNALREIKPTPPERSALTGPLQPFRLGGKIKYTKHNSHGDIDGVILEDGATLVFPPHAGHALAEHLEPEQPLHAVGFGTSNQYGTSVAVAMLGSSPESMAPIGPAPHKVRKPKAPKTAEDQPGEEREKEDW